MAAMISSQELKGLCSSNSGACGVAPPALQLVDVRSPSEFAAGHIPGAENIPMDEISGRIRDLRPSQTIVLICQRGSRAMATADLLQAHGVEAIVLQGGTHAWASCGGWLISNVKTTWSLERQVRLGAGMLVVVGCSLAVLVHPAWLALPAFVGLGLAFAGLTDICAMASLLARMPWNQPRKLAAPPPNRIRPVRAERS